VAGPMKWDEYGAICRENGQLALEVFACTTSPVAPGPPPPDVLAEHKAYIASLETSGRVFLAGPLSNAEGTHMSGAGLIVFAARDMEDARSLADGDPMHIAGIRTYSLQAWRLNEGAPIPGLRLSRRSFDIG
jgi:uncharacterized protein YciI